MKRYRVLRLNFDFTANHFDPEGYDTWSEEAKERYQEHLEGLRAELGRQYGTDGLEYKVQNLRDIGAQPMSVITFHNSLYQQARHAFIVGAYYPALTATAALGERILNDLVLTLRESYPAPAEYPQISIYKTFSQWKVMIDTLESWNVLLPDVVECFRRLLGIRGRSIHYNPIQPREMRGMAVKAMECMNTIIHRQFGILGSQPWFIPGIRGASFVAKAWETQPFVRAFLLPHAALVGPNHWLELDEATGLWSVHDHDYEAREISDEEFGTLVDPGGAEPIGSIEAKDPL